MLYFTLSDMRLACGAFALLALTAYGSDGDPSAPPDTRPGESQNTGLAVREFDPIGKGTLTMGDKTLSFQVADCELDELELPTGWVRDIEVIGAGKDAERDFFIHIKRLKQGRRSNTSVSYKHAALPAAYNKNIDMNDPWIDALWQIINKSDGGMSMMTKPDDLVVEGRSIRSVEPLRMVELTRGTMSARLPEGMLQVDCL